MWGVCVKRIIYFLQSLLALFFWPYSKLLSLKIKKRCVPPITNPLLTKSATQLTQLIRTQKVSSVEVLRAYIDRINVVEPYINSVVQNRFEDALVEAKQVDEMIALRPDPKYWADAKPLLGVPISIKECIGVAGMSNNAGRKIPSSRIAKQDAEAVKNLREAGAIPIVVTNTPELCLFWETYNNAKGLTKNPYNTRLSAAGSSGGEGALISAAGSVIGLGSDIVGSGRLPPMFCGIFGHKPTPRTMSLDGHLPTSTDPDWGTFLVLSPIARYAEDLALVFRGASPQAAVQLRLSEEVNLAELKVFYMEEYKSPIMHNVQPAVKEAIRNAASHFKTHGIAPEKVTIDNFDAAMAAVAYLMLSMKSPETVLMRSDDPEDWTLWDAIKALLKKLSGCSNYTLYAIIFGVLKKFVEYSPETSVERRKKTKVELTKRFQDLLGENGVLILPVFPSTADQHFTMYYKMMDSTYCAIFNLVEMPATACTLGLTKNGSPVGVQIVANKFQDRLTLAVARELQNAFGGWVPPTDKKELRN